MSLQDQQEALRMLNRIVYGTTLVAFPISYLIGSFTVAVCSIGVAGLVAAVACVPNWRQRPDPEQIWADEELVKKYYTEYEAAKKAKAETGTAERAPSPPAARDASSGGSKQQKGKKKG